VSRVGAPGEYSLLLRRPRYPSFLLTVLLSRVTVTMFQTSGVLLILARTGSPALAGAVAAAATLPGAVAGPVLGAWLDVAPHRRVLIVFDQVTSVVSLLALVAVAGHGPNWTLPLIAVVYSVTRPLSYGSFFSALAEVVGSDLLDRASTVEATSLNLSFVIGPALAGALSGATSAATAIDVQVVLTAIVAVLIAINPAFEARPKERSPSAAHALREGIRAVRRIAVLRATGIAATMAAFGWGLMAVGFPLYAARTLHAGTHAGGYLWAAMASGSIVGTFALAGTPSRRRAGMSYALLGLSALLWPLAHVLALGIALIGFTGFLEGPAYSGTIALRQRHVPPAIRAQVMTTLSGIGLVAAAAGAAVGGLVHRPLPLIIMFMAVNQLAALAAAGPGSLRRHRVDRVPQE
jgi:MFS family permease